jgi:glycosyltransferase involved in cell wall biosynthesis
MHSLVFLASHKDGSKLAKCGVAAEALARMTYLMIRGDIDIVHIHCGDIVSHDRKYLFFRIARFFGKKVVLHLHGALFITQFEGASPGWQERLRRFFEESQLVICLSESWSNDIERLFPRSRRMVVPNGIPLPPFSHSRGSIPKQTIRLAFLGLIGPRKGVFDLLKAVQRLVGQGLAIHLTIGGNGETARLRDEINTAGLQDHVEYAGWVTQPEKELLLSSTDIFVLPSYGEGMPMSILEAMSFGLPVVSTRVGGIPELVRDGQTGFLVDPGDVEALCAKLRLLTEDPGLRVRMGEAARRTVEQNHDVGELGRKIGRLYNDLCSPKPGCMA